MSNSIGTIEQLLAAVQASDRNYDVEKIKKAYEVAEKAHKGQLRQSGDPYISHPVSVAIILVDLGMDTDCLCAALLHDVVEDTDVTLGTLSRQFGEDVAVMVNGVTKLGQVPLVTKEEQQAENIRKMLLAMNEDIRVIIIKLADRLHNMRTLDFKSDARRREISLETMEIYAPIAHRLGIRAVKEELEDRALRYLDPIGYKEIEDTLALKKGTGRSSSTKSRKKSSQGSRNTALSPTSRVGSRASTASTARSTWPGGALRSFTTCTPCGLSSTPSSSATTS